jgi:hypothetical protein
MNMCIRGLVVRRLIQLDAKKFAEKALKKDSRIRYVGIVDRQFNVLVSQMREGTASPTAPESDRNFVQLIPPIILDAVDKLEPPLGTVGSVTVRYEKVLLVFFSRGNYVVVLSFNPDVSTPFMSALTSTYGRDMLVGASMIVDEYSEVTLDKSQFPPNMT